MQNNSDVEDLKLLLITFSKLVSENNLATRESMSRIDSLLKHAVEILNDSFFSANSSIVKKDMKQNVTSEVIVDDTSGDSLLGTLQKALVMAKQLNSTLSKTTQSLQVEDIVSQIVFQVNNNTLKLDQVIESIQQLTNEKDDDLKCKLEIQMGQIRKQLVNSSVRQSSLDEGGVELF